MCCTLFLVHLVLIPRSWEIKTLAATHATMGHIANYAQHRAPPSESPGSIGAIGQTSRTGRHGPFPNDSPDIRSRARLALASTETQATVSSSAPAITISQQQKCGFSLNLQLHSLSLVCQLMSSNCPECDRLWATYSAAVAQSIDVGKLAPADSEAKKLADLAWDAARLALTKHVASHPKPGSAETK
jgi:hypothetical protein